MSSIRSDQRVERTLGVNLLFVDGSNLTGPGFYACQLFEQLATLAMERKDFKLIGYAQHGAERHFSKIAWSCVLPMRNLRGRVRRVLFEQISLPLQASQDKVSILFSPAFVSPLWGAPHLVVGICDMYYRVIPDLIEAQQRRYWQLMIPPSARRCERIITISESSKRDIERYLPASAGKTHAFPLASRFAPRPRQQPAEPIASSAIPFVLMVANLTANKNVRVVVDAVAKLRSEGFAIDFVHIGSDVLGQLADRVRTLDASGYVHQLGKVSDDELLDRYRHCLCTIVPSLYEGFGMPVLEAQSCGAAMICSDRGAVPEAAGEGAIFFDPENPVALAAAIQRYLEDEPLRRLMQERALVNVANFSWRNTAEGTLGVFMDIWRKAQTPVCGRLEA